MKNEKTNLVISAVVALVIGVVIGAFLIAPATSGNAKAAIASRSTYGYDPYPPVVPPQPMFVTNADCVKVGGTVEPGSLCKLATKDGGYDYLPIYGISADRCNNLVGAHVVGGSSYEGGASWCVIGTVTLDIIDQ